MAIHRHRIEYAVYSPDHDPAKRTPYFEFQTFRRAQALARKLGAGSRIYRDLQQTNKKGRPLGHWWCIGVFQWTGTKLVKLPLERQLALDREGANAAARS